MTRLVELPCRRCLEQLRLQEDDEAFLCPHCELRFELHLCEHCESVGQTYPVRRGRHLYCEWCRNEYRVPFVGDRQPATVADRRDELDERGLLAGDPDDVLVAGFTLVGGTGFAIEHHANCSLISLPDAVDVRAETGGEGVATIPYAEITVLELGGGVDRRGGGFFGGGFGLQGAAEGMAIASVLNALTSKSSISTGVQITSNRGELLLHHGTVEANEMRRQLSPLFTRYHAATQNTASPSNHATDSAGQLERLAGLRDRGVLSEAEFQAAREPLVRRLTAEE